MTQYRARRPPRHDWFPFWATLIIVIAVLAILLGVAHGIQARNSCTAKGGQYLTWKFGEVCVVNGKWEAP